MRQYTHRTVANVGFCDFECLLQFLIPSGHSCFFLIPLYKELKVCQMLKQ